MEVVAVAIVFPMATPSFPGWGEEGEWGVYLHSKPVGNHIMMVSFMEGGVEWGAAAVAS